MELLPERYAHLFASTACKAEDEEEVRSLLNEWVDLFESGDDPWRKRDIRIRLDFRFGVH
jgi:hypothetical protein